MPGGAGYPPGDSGAMHKSKTDHSSRSGSKKVRNYDPKDTGMSRGGGSPAIVKKYPPSKQRNRSV